MRVPKVGIFEPMNIAVLENETRLYARRLEDSEKQRHGLTRAQARADVARKLSVAPGTLESVSKRRVKDPLRLRGLYDRLRQAVVQELNEEITRLTHERDCLVATGADPRSDEMAAVEQDLAKARQVLGLAPR